MSFHTVFSCLFSVRTKTHEHYRKIEYTRKRMVTESMCQKYIHTITLSVCLSFFECLLCLSFFHCLFYVCSVHVGKWKWKWWSWCWYAWLCTRIFKPNKIRWRAPNSNAIMSKFYSIWAKNVCVSRRWFHGNRASLWTFSFYAICEKNLKKKTFPILSLSLFPRFFAIIRNYSLMTAKIKFTFKAFIFSLSSVNFM